MNTKKDYEAIARIIIDAESDAGFGVPTWTAYPARHQGIQHVVKRLADHFAAENPRFNRALFERACDPYQEPRG